MWAVVSVLAFLARVKPHDFSTIVWRNISSALAEEEYFIKEMNKATKTLIYLPQFPSKILSYSVFIYKMIILKDQVQLL